MLKRALTLPGQPRESFFLWGPRQTGKSTLLRELYPDAIRFDLLKTDLFVRYTQSPSLLREELLARKHPGLVIIDEVQKVPALLDEVHWLIENEGWIFGLCGSSARKVRRGHANLLGGRAVRYELFGVVSAELGADFDLLRALNHGYLPRHYLSESPGHLLRAYVSDYLKEEIAAEGLVRNLPAFSTFLSAAVLSDAEMVNYSTIARDCGVSSPTVKEYFQILVDTLLGRYLPAYTRRPKRRVVRSPRFYFADVGVVNVLARRGRLEPGSELLGKAFENWVCHEIEAHRHYSEQHYELAYWRLPSGIEVDFVLGDMQVAVEAKATPRVHADHLKGLREIRLEHPRIGSRVLVSLERSRRRTEDGILILPARDFAEMLWSGELTRSL
jgi:predicted AAA+ superfamily ATPase